MHVRRRPMFQFEFPDDGGGVPAPAPAAEAGAVPPPDPAPAAAGPAAGSEGLPSPAAAAPAWANDPSFRDAVAEEAQAIAEATIQRYLAGQGPPSAGQQQGWQQDPGYPAGAANPPANPFDPSAFDPFSDQFPASIAGAFQSMQQQVTQAVQQALAPLAEQTQQAQQQELDQRVQDIASDVVARLGDWPVGDDQGTRAAANEMMLAIATQIAPQEVARYGPGPRAVEAAMQKAHGRVMQLLGAAGQHGQATYRNQLSTLGGAPPEPRGGSAGFQQPVFEGDERDVARRIAMRSAAL